MDNFDESFFVPFLIFSIPILAIVGGIVTGVVKVLGRQRMAELVQQERIAAIQRGLDISKLPPLPASLDDDAGYTPAERNRRLAQGLMIGGLVTLAAGVGISTFLGLIETEKNIWAVGFIPAAVGIALLISWSIVRPKEA